MAQEMTAVEWLIKEIQNRQNGIVDTLPVLSTDELYVKAKQMEKEHIVNAHLTGLIYPLETDASLQAEEYYQQTYKTK